MTDRSLLTAARIAAMPPRAKVHFLNPAARRANRSLGDPTGLTGLGFHLVEVAPGDESTESHSHRHEDECLYVLAGTATARLGDESFPIGPGDFLAYPRGGPPHSLRNTGDTVLRYLMVGERRAHDVVDYPRVGKRLYRDQGLPEAGVDLAALATPGPEVGKK